MQLTVLTWNDERLRKKQIFEKFQFRREISIGKKNWN